MIVLKVVICVIICNNICKNSGIGKNDLYLIDVVEEILVLILK